MAERSNKEDSPPPRERIKIWSVEMESQLVSIAASALHLHTSAKMRHQRRLKYEAYQSSYGYESHTTPW